MGVQQIPKSESARKVYPREGNSSTTPSIKPVTFRSHVGCSNYWAIPASRLTRQQAGNPNPGGLHQKVRVVVHRGLHDYKKDDQTMKCHVCTEAIWSCSNKLLKNKFILSWVNFQCWRDIKKALTIRMLQSSAELMCRNLWRNFIFLQQCSPGFEWPQFLPAYNLPDSKFDAVIHVKELTKMGGTDTQIPTYKINPYPNQEWTLWNFFKKVKISL